MNNSELIKLGNEAFIKAEYDEAIASYVQVSHGDSNYAIAQANLANTYLTLKKYQQAILYANNALSEDSQSFLALIVLGSSFLETDNLSDSQIYFERALAIDSTDIWLQNYLSQVYQKIGDFSSALNSANKAVELSDCDDSQAINMGYLLYEVALEKGRDYILPTAQKLLDSYGHNSILSHMCSSILNNSDAKIAPPHFVRNIFDVFAPDFEDVLQKLEYAVPTLIAEKMLAHYSLKKDSSLKILDAGCGTGLCGNFLAQYAQNNTLIGVDLSPQMLNVANGKNVYNQLVEADLVGYLQDQKSTFNLIVAADVFTYFGALETVLLSCFRALLPSSRILFSITQNNLNDDDYFLHLSGRFLHTKNYVINVLQKTGFLVEDSSFSTLRQEGDEAVNGWIFSALKI